VGAQQQIAVLVIIMTVTHTATHKRTQSHGGKLEREALVSFVIENENAKTTKNMPGNKHGKTLTHTEARKQRRKTKGAQRGSGTPEKRLDLERYFLHFLCFYG